MAIISSGRTSQTEAGTPIVVTTTADTGTGSFRQALVTAANNPGADTITFDATVFPAASPATIQPVTNYVVEGAAASQSLTIDATGAGVVIDAQFVDDGGAALHFRPIGAFSGLTLKNFVIENFHPDSGGNGLEVGFQVTDISDILIDHMTFAGHDGDGLLLATDASISGVTIQDSTFHINSNNGMFLEATSLDDIQIRRNTVQTNGHNGIEIKAGSSSVPATVDVTENNISGNTDHGIGIFALDQTNGPHVTLNRNNTTNDGGLGINLGGGNENPAGVTANDQGDSDDGPNTLLNFPVLNGVGPTGIVGTACTLCTIDLFIADSDPSGHGEPAGYFTTGTADSDGNFNISGCGQNQGANVTATATDPNGNTSESAENYILPTTPACSELNGDLDCDGDSDPRDALIAVIHDAGSNQISRDPDCPEPGSNLFQPAALGGPLLFGDVNCDTLVNSGDGITILQHFADVTLFPAPAAGCTPIGQPLPQ